MARANRDNSHGATYHVMNRGNRKAAIFEDDFDRRRFVSLLIEEKESHHVKVLGGCQMANHFHLVLGTPEGNLSEFMDQLEGRYARYLNRRHGHVGHVFQGRFRDVFIEHDLHLLTALCYVFLNPVSAGLVSAPEHYKWSTYAAAAGYAAPLSYIDIEWLDVLFAAESRRTSQQRLRRVIEDAKPVGAYLQQYEPGVDPDAIRRAIRSYVGSESAQATVPRAYRGLLRPALEDLFADRTRDRSALIYEAHVSYGYKMAEIANVIGLHPASVSRRFCAHRRHRS